MRHRQNLRDLHHSTPPSSQQPPTPSYQAMAPPSQLPMANQAHGQSSLSQSDIFAELLRLGLNPDEIAKQSAPPPSSSSSSNRSQEREDMLKNLQTLLSKRDMTGLLQKGPHNNDWTNTGQLEYQSAMGGGPIMSAGSSGAGAATSSGAASMSFTNNIINGNSSQQREQDIQYASAQQHQVAAAAAAAAAASAAASSHHQHFRVPTTMHNLPLQQQQQQLLSQHKSVLSLHHHQNDPTTHGQRLNHQHKLNAAAAAAAVAAAAAAGQPPPNNSSLASLSDMSGGPHSSALSSSQNTTNIFNPNYTITSSGLTPRVPTLMDTIRGGGGQQGLKNMHDTSPSQPQIVTMNNRDKLKSLARQQQLQRQLQRQNVTSTSTSLSSSNISATSQQHHQQHHQSQQILQPSPPQTTPALSSVPKSLLNLAACSTSPPNTSNVNSMTSGNRMAGQLSNVVRNSNNVQASNTGGNNVSNNRSQPRNNNITGSNSNLLQQMISRSSNAKNPPTSAANRSNYSNFTLSSLLSEDQSNRSVINQNVTPTNIRLTNSQSNLQAQKRPASVKSDEQNVNLSQSASPKDAYLAYLHQERAVRTASSIGEINNQSATNPMLDQPNQLQSELLQQQSLLAATLQDAHEPVKEIQSRRDIESALSRVEARNDLSLLYPTVSLANNSQKRINSLAAGLLDDNPNVVTDEVAQMVQEGCNIIYECKTCSNLFRSLANLIKHKREYCKESNNKAIQFELNRRSQIRTAQTTDLSVTKNVQIDVGPSRIINHRDSYEPPKNSLLLSNNRQKHPEVSSAPSSNGSQYNLRGKRVDVSCLTGRDMSSSRSRNSVDKTRDSKSHSVSNPKNTIESTNSAPGQTSLSRLLQSQPRSRTNPMKDSALMDALSMGTNISANRGGAASNPMSNFEEQLVRNSSLAKTLLSENVKSMSVNQSHMELTNIESNSNQKKLTAPKRKLLEDCIKKVKRDKLGEPNVGDDQASRPSIERNDSEGAALPETTRSQVELDQFRDPLDIEDSADSDVLTMDIDECYIQGASRRKQHLSDKKSSSRSHSRESPSFSYSNSRLNSSSALLKALTRPVESRPPTYPSSQIQNIDSDAPSTKTQNSETKDTLNEPITDEVPVVSAASDQQSNESSTVEEANNNDQAHEQLDIKPVSPVLDRHYCEACDLELPNHETLFKHIIEEHKSTKRIHPCIFCSLSFITLENVCRHIIDIHKKTKAQVSRLKDVVESRSFYSDDFAACADIPASCHGKSDERTETTKPRLTPDSLSDSAATQQILNDTVALVSMASSPTKSNAFSSPKKLPSLVSRCSSRLAAKRSPVSRDNNVTNTENIEESNHYSEEHNSDLAQMSSDAKESERASPTIMETEDMLSDSMIPSISDEQLAILEKQEAEIEAERLRREQETKSVIKAPSAVYQEAGDRALQHGEDEFQIEDDNQTSRTHPSTNDQSADEGSILQDGYIEGDDESNLWEQSQSERESGDKSAIEDEGSRQSGGAGDEAGGYDDGPLTRESRESTERRISRGKHMVPPSSGALDVNEDQLDDNDDDDVEDGDTQQGDNLDAADGEKGQKQRLWNSGDISDTDDSSTCNDEGSNSSNDDEQSSNSVYDSEVEDNHLQKGVDDENDDILAGPEYGELPELNDDEQADDDDSQAIPVITSKRKSSHSGSIKGGDTEYTSSEVGDKALRKEYQDGGASSHGSSKASTKHQITTMDNAGGCKLKLKAATSSSVSGGGSGASASSGSSSANSSGGIMKLKIQLKTQPDEKSKVYRIVE